MRDVQALVPMQPLETVAKRSSGLRALAKTLPHAWHLLSLDAPTVAATWCAAFLMAVDASRDSRALRWPVLFLSTATWICYVGDRVLDARATSGCVLRARHRFYGRLWRKQRWALLAAVGLATLLCAAIALAALSAVLLASFAALTASSLVYFIRVHSSTGSKASPLAKEAAVAAIFAIGCTLPAWTAARPELRPSLAVAGTLFGALCWLNCVAIERWESGGSLSAGVHPSTRWAARHLTWLLIAGAALAGTLRFLQAARANPSLGMLTTCLASAFLLLASLEAFRLRLSSEALRVLADVVLLTPLLWWATMGVAR